MMHNASKFILTNNMPVSCRAVNVKFTFKSNLEPYVETTVTNATSNGDE